MYLKLLDDYEKELEARGLKISPELHDSRFDFATWLSIRDDMQPFHPPEQATNLDLKTVYSEWLEERRKSGMSPLSSDAHIHISALIERFEAAQHSVHGTGLKGWRCPKCNTWNNDRRSVCLIDGTPRP